MGFNNIIVFRILSCKIVYKHSNIENNVNLMKVHNSANAAMYFFNKVPTYLINQVELLIAGRESFAVELGIF